MVPATMTTFLDTESSNSPTNSDLFVRSASKKKGKKSIISPNGLSGTITAISSLSGNSDIVNFKK